MQEVKVKKTIRNRKINGAENSEPTLETPGRKN